MEQIEENAKIVVIMLEQLINKESNTEINRSLNDLKIYHVAILNLIIYEWNCYKALTLMEKIKEWRTEKNNLPAPTLKGCPPSTHRQDGLTS